MGKSRGFSYEKMNRLRPGIGNKPASSIDMAAHDFQVLTEHGDGICIRWQGVSVGKYKHKEIFAVGRAVYEYFRMISSVSTVMKFCLAQMIRQARAYTIAGIGIIA